MGWARSHASILVGAVITGFVVLAGLHSVFEWWRADPLTVTTFCRRLEQDNWRFHSEHSAMGVQFLLYEKVQNSLVLSAMLMMAGDQICGLDFSISGPEWAAKEAPSTVDSHILPIAESMLSPLGEAIRHHEAVREVG
jgi:hypothetical protein